jgi:hypothetical protein
MVAPPVSAHEMIIFSIARFFPDNGFIIVLWARLQSFNVIWLSNVHAD